jgi:hypothetical protein
LAVIARWGKKLVFRVRASDNDTLVGAFGREGKRSTRRRVDCTIRAMARRWREKVHLRIADII